MLIFDDVFRWYFRALQNNTEVHDYYMKYNQQISSTAYADLIWFANFAAICDNHWCYLSYGEHFKFDILADSMEQMPELVVGSVLRIHHLVVEVFNGVPDGRVYSGPCVTLVQEGVGDIITPCTRAA